MTDFSNTTAPCIQTCNSIANETILTNSIGDVLGWRGPQYE